MTKPDTSVKDEMITIAQDLCRLGPIELVNNNDDHVMWVSTEGQEPRLIIEAALSKPLRRGLGKVMTAVLSIEDTTGEGVVRSSIRATRNWNGPKGEVKEDEFVAMILDEFRSYASQPELVACRGLGKAAEERSDIPPKRKRPPHMTHMAKSACKTVQYKPEEVCR